MHASAKGPVASAARAIANLVLPQPPARSTSAAWCPGGGPGLGQSRIPCLRSSSAAWASGWVPAWRRPLQGPMRRTPHPNQRSSNAITSTARRSPPARPAGAPASPPIPRISAPCAPPLPTGGNPRSRCSHPLPTCQSEIVCLSHRSLLVCEAAGSPARAKSSLAGQNGGCFLGELGASSGLKLLYPRIRPAGRAPGAGYRSGLSCGLVAVDLRARDECGPHRCCRAERSGTSAKGPRPWASVPLYR